MNKNCISYQLYLTILGWQYDWLYTPIILPLYLAVIDNGRVQWLRGRASDFRLGGPGFESCAAVLKPWARFFTLHCSSSLSCINEYLAIDKWWICVRTGFAH